MTTPRPGSIRYGTPNRATIARMLATPPEQDGPIYMVNLMRYREQAAYRDGQGAAISGREADDRYAPLAILAEIGARPVLFGDVLQQTGEATPAWHRVGIVRYPSRASFFAMQRRGDFQERHVHKDAGMEQTIVLGCVPAETVNVFSGERRAAGWTVRVDVLPDGKVTDAEQGCVFAVEGEVIGDGRNWRVVRLTRMLDGASLMAAERSGYTLLVRAAIDLLTPDAEG